MKTVKDNGDKQTQTRPADKVPEATTGKEELNEEQLETVAGGRDSVMDDKPK
jgi:hypothetical protein